MNRWLERQQPASPELLELIALASAAFREWIGKLRGRESLAFDGKAIVERAQKLRAVEPEPEEITVGTTRLARSFFDIYAKEALQHVQTLQAQPPVPVEPAEPAPALAAKSGKELRVMKDDIDQQLLPIFLEEAETLVPHIGSDLRDWKANPSDQNISDSLRRGLHTLKGSA